MESSPSRPVANRPLNHSSSSISPRNQYQQPFVSEMHSSNGSHPHYTPQQQEQVPFFERASVRGDVKVVQNYSRIVKQQHSRLKEFEKIHKDLEARLETEAKQKELLEALLEQREREWEHRLERTVAEREQFKQKMNEERANNAYLSEQLSRKDQDIHRMMQRKYDSSERRSIKSVRQQSAERERAHPSSASSSPGDVRRSEFGHQGPHEYIMKDSPEETREQNVRTLLNDLFGIIN